MRGFEEHCLSEVQAALPHLGADAKILIDDTPAAKRGKGRLAVPWLLEHGWRIAVNGYQILLERTT